MPEGSGACLRACHGADSYMFSMEPASQAGPVNKVNLQATLHLTTSQEMVENHEQMKSKTKKAWVWFIVVILIRQT